MFSAIDVLVSRDTYAIDRLPSTKPGMSSSLQVASDETVGVRISSWKPSTIWITNPVTNVGIAIRNSVETSTRLSRKPRPRRPVRMPAVTPMTASMTTATTASRSETGAASAISSPTDCSE